MKPSHTVADIEELTEGSGLQLTPLILGEWEEPEPASALARFRARCEAFFDLFDPIEAEVVRMFLARDRASLAAARAFDEAGKGLLYPILAAAALLVEGPTTIRVILACAIATALSQALYPAFKQLVRRERPLAFDPDLCTGVAPMDRFSWPSGHSITAIAFLVPFVVAGSELVVLFAPLAMLVLWSRLALGHHFPSDVAGGAILGAVIALPVSLFLGV